MSDEFEEVITLSDFTTLTVKIDSKFIYITQEFKDVNNTDTLILTYDEWRRLKQVIDKFFENKKSEESLEIQDAIDELELLE